MEKRLILGLIEPVIFENGKRYLAKIDTGADSSSIDESLVNKCDNKKIISRKKIRSALGQNIRPTMKFEIELQGIKFYKKFSIADRSKLKHKILIGKDILKKENFLIDPLKYY